MSLDGVRRRVFVLYELKSRA